MKSENEEVLKAILGKDSKSWYLKDSDGDGVINILDCKPEDKNRQGFFHDIKEKIVQKLEERKAAIDDVEGKIDQGDIKEEKDIEKYYTKESPRARIAKERLRRTELKEARDESYHKEKLARAKEQGKRSAQNSGFAGFTKNIGSVATAIETYTKPKSKVMYVKQGKKYKPVKQAEKREAPKVFTMEMDFIGGGRHQDRDTPDFFGVRSNNKEMPKIFGDNKGIGGIPKIF